MVKSRYVIGMIFLLVISIFLFSGCNFGSTPKTITSIEVDPTTIEESYDVDTFDISTIKIKVNYSDGTSNLVSVKKTMLSSEHFSLLSTSGEHSIPITFEGKTTTVVIKIEYSEVRKQLMAIYTLATTEGGFTGTYEEWLESIQGEDGLDIKSALINNEGHLILTLSDDSTIDAGKVVPEDAKEVEFQTSETHIQWRYVGDETWVDLITLESLKGLKGDAGVDGKEVELQTSETHIQWRYVGEETWVDLVLLSSLIGPKGEQGISITDTAINELGELVVTYSDDTTKNLGAVVRIYLVSFKDDNGYVLDSQLVLHGSSTVTIPDNPTKEGFIFDGWYWDNETFNDPFTANSLLDRPISSDLTLYAKWIEEEIQTESLKITFDSKGGSSVEPQYINRGDKLNIPIVSKEGHTLEGWYTSLDEGETLFEKWSLTISVVSDEVTLYAKWTINQYTVTFHSNGGSPIDPIVQDFATAIIEPSTPSREGYTFSGWYNDSLLSNPYEFTTIPAENINLYAKWTINQYTITFNSNEGSALSSITQDFATEVYVPATPTREGYTFDAWYSDLSLAHVFTFTTMPAENTTLYAKWNIISYDITYNLDGGINGTNPSSYQITTETIILENPTKEGYTFGGWFDNEELIGTSINQIEKGTVEDVTLYAKWIINRYTVTYNTYNQYNPLNDIPLEVDELIVYLATGTYHSAVLTSTGRIFTWGSNSYGQLGDGTTIDRIKPTEITSNFDLVSGEIITSVSLGGTHSSVMTSTGRVFTCGFNSSGQLGDGTTTSRKTPIDITTHFGLSIGETIVSISLGAEHSSAVTSTGRVFTWGANWNNQLGDETNEHRYTPTDITSKFNLQTDETIVFVSLGFYHSSALSSTGRVFTWGLNSSGQLGDGMSYNKSTPTTISGFMLKTDETIVSLSLGNNFSAALTSTGRVFTWGSNNSGRLGDGTETSRSMQLDITTNFGLETGETIVSISVGNHSSALSSTGRVFTWGLNSSGQLGDGTTTTRRIPTDITNNFSLVTGETIVSMPLGVHSSALTSTGRILTWGYNYEGQLGDGTTVNKYLPTDISSIFKPAFSTEKVTYMYNEFFETDIPTREGYSFDGWYQDSDFTTLHSFSNMPAEDITLYAKWDINEYNIVFYAENEIVSEYTLSHGEEIMLPENPFKLPTSNNYYDFAEWIGYDDSMIATTDLTFVADFVSYPFIFIEDTKITAELRHIAAVEYIHQYLIENYPEEALKIHHGTPNDLIMLNDYVQTLISSATSDEEKIQIIYNWIKNTIQYENCASPYPMDVFKTLKGDCLNIALLMVDMLKLSGLPATIVVGDRGSMDFITETNMDLYVDHAWVLVYVNGSWELLDPLFETYMPDIDYIKAWYYTAKVDWTVPYYPNINLSAVDGVYFMNGLYYPVFEGVIRKDLSGSSIFADYYSVNWHFNTINTSMLYEDLNKNIPVGSAFTNGWIYIISGLYVLEEQQLKLLKPNGQATASIIYEQGEEIIYFSKEGELYHIEGINFDELDIVWGILEVEVGAHFRFVTTLDMVDNLLTVEYSISDESLAHVDEFGNITALASGEVMVTYDIYNPKGGLMGQGAFIFLIDYPFE